MLSPSDFIFLPYTPDLTQAGIAYACRSLPHTYDRMGGHLFHRLRRIVAGKAVELAFRRYLVSQGVPFDVLGATPFTDPDRYDVALGGRRCDIKSFLILNKAKIVQARRDPQYILEAAALVPVDQLVSERLNDRDLYLFAFVHALVTRDREDLARATAARQPIYPIYPFPSAWAQPNPWASLGRLTLKNDLPDTVELELGGQDKTHAFLIEKLTLSPRARQQAQNDFFALAYLHLHDMPQGPIGIHSPRLAKPLVIQPQAWDNIWVYGMEIVLTGYMTCGEFRRRSREIPPNSRVLQYTRTRTRNRYMPVRQLYPLAELFTRTKEWEKYKKR